MPSTESLILSDTLFPSDKQYNTKPLTRAVNLSTWRFPATAATLMLMEDMGNVVEREGRRLAEELGKSVKAQNNLDASIQANITAVKRLLEQEEQGRRLIYMFTALTAAYPGVTQRQLAGEFEISQASIRDWIKKGNTYIAKEMAEENSPER